MVANSYAGVAINQEEDYPGAKSDSKSGPGP